MGRVCNRPFGLLEGNIIELKDGRLTLLMRADWGGFLWRSDSTDGGVTWCDAYQTDIPNPSSLAQLLRLQDGRIMLVHNPTCGEVGKRDDRSKPAVWLSNDEMESWYIKQDVLSGKYLSYPSPLQLRDGRVIFSYDRDRRSAHFVEVLLDC